MLRMACSAVHLCWMIGRDRLAWFGPLRSLRFGGLMLRAVVEREPS
jgi:hypothetical protein